VRLEMRCVAVAATLVLGLLSAPRPPVVRAAAPDKCDPGKDKVTITFQLRDGKCAVVPPVADACVDRGNSIHWTLANKDCTFKAGSDAVVISQPTPKSGQKAFKYAECSPNQPAWPAGKSIPLNCKVPKDADEGLYKYSLSGQITPLDPDVEVRRGGGGGD
jgi:hypothetical protein